MKKRILSLFLALVLCIGLTISASAASGTEYVIDEVGYLSNDEVASLNRVAASLYDAHGVGIFFVYSTEEYLQEYDVSPLVGGLTDYVVMMENDTSWFVHYGGLGEQIDLATEEALRAVYDSASTYVGGVNDFLNATAELFPVTAEPSDSGTQQAEEYVLFDEAYLLTEAEQAALTEKLLEISHTYNAQIVIATVDSTSGGIDHYVEYVYDSMGFGYGENHDGVLLLVCMNEREYRILSNGFPGDAISTSAIDTISDIIVSDLSDGNYAAAFDTFADQCVYYLDGYLNGFPFAFGTNLIICLVIGLLAGVITAFVLKGQLKSVRKQNQANVYVKPGSMNVTLHNDFFLYREVTRSKKESSSSSKSGSSRSVGGGSF